MGIGMFSPLVDFCFLNICRGIGLALVERIISRDETQTICLACRNKAKAESVREDLLQQFPQAHIDIVVCDVSSIKSVKQSCSEIRQK